MQFAEKLRRCYSKYLYFLAQLVPGIFVVLETVLPYAIYQTKIVRIKVFGISWSILVLIHLLFLHRLYEYKRKKTEVALFTIVLVAIFAILNVQRPYPIKNVGTYVIVILTSLALYNVSLHIEQFAKKIK